MITSFIKINDAPDYIKKRIKMSPAKFDNHNNAYIRVQQDTEDSFVIYPNDNIPCGMYLTHNNSTQEKFLHRGASLFIMDKDKNIFLEVISHEGIMTNIDRKIYELYELQNIPISITIDIINL